MGGSTSERRPMGMIIVLLLAQAISAEPAGEAASPTADVRLFQASPGGRFLLVADPSRLYVLDAKTFERRAAVEGACVAAAFDAEDRALTFVDGKDLVRMETPTWRVLWRHPLPGAEFLKERGERVRVRRPGGFDEGLLVTEPEELLPQAFVSSAGEVVYRSRAIDGRPTVSRAWWEEEALRHAGLGGHVGVASLKIDGVLGLADGIPVVGVDGMAGIVVREKAYSLAAGACPLGAGVFGDRLAVSTRNGDLVYELGTFRSRSFEPADVRAAAFGPVRGWAFTATSDRIQAWRPESLGPRVLVAEGAFLRLAVDGAAETLFAVTADGRLRRWTLAR